MGSDVLLYCGKCFSVNGIKVPLKLKIIETTEWDAEFKRTTDEINDLTKQSIPTFSVETGEGVVEWEPKFICPVCDTPAWLLNRNISYNEDEDLLYIDDLDEASLLGYRESTPSKEPELPRIQKVCPSS